MFTFKQEDLITVLEGYEGVEVASYGRPRDGFELAADIPHFTSGFGGKYEMVHTNVPAGVMIAVGDLEDLNLNDFDVLKSQLAEIDIYPTGHSGDFSGKDPQESRDWFNGCSRLDNEVNNQTPISHAKKLSPEGLGDKFNELVDFLSDNMHIFKDSDKGGALVPADKVARSQIVIDILDGLSNTVRYTRLDQPAKVFQLTAEVNIEKEDKGEIYVLLEGKEKVLVLRKHKNDEKDITPLDRGMIGRTYVTSDGEELGDRGHVDIGEVMQKVEELEAQRAGEEKPDFLRGILAGGHKSEKAPQVV